MVLQYLAQGDCCTDASRTTAGIGWRTVLLTPSPGWGAGPECGAGWYPSSFCVQPHWVVPLCISLSCDLPKHPAPTPVHFPNKSLEETVFGLFHISGLSTRHLPSREKDQEFDI